ncbi:MAG: hypothetical protein BJ554DRAFT_6175 [Olpidium bornovanus]|uniref:Zinc/iron permease n=1 Tax=Olpidium bornovanus TaxID=278681 RepID=A0A8H7ZYC4_9FUNG|nr:MAG: hypothetical protein BJ554DRAFT_6175 [Olpidium bornovanus]
MKTIWFPFVAMSSSEVFLFRALPEGLITFVGSKASSAMGLSVFLAIFIHNIPEGLMIAVPLLVATSSRTKAFTLASILGGLSQPLGAAVGYLILPSDAHLPGGHAPGVSSLYGCLFAFVSGLMTCVVIQGMLPAAVRFDPSGHIVTTGFFSGVALVAVTWAFLGGEI